MSGRSIQRSHHHAVVTVSSLSTFVSVLLSREKVQYAFSESVFRILETGNSNGINLLIIYSMISQRLSLSAFENLAPCTTSSTVSSNSRRPKLKFFQLPEFTTCPSTKSSNGTRVYLHHVTNLPTEPEIASASKRWCHIRYQPLAACQMGASKCR